MLRMFSGLKGSHEEIDAADEADAELEGFVVEGLLLDILLLLLLREDGLELLVLVSCSYLSTKDIYE